MDLLTLILVAVVIMALVWLVVHLPEPWRVPGIVIAVIVLLVALIRLLGLA